MHFNPDVAPAMRNTNPEKDHQYLAQALLMGRDPSGELDWVERYAEKFRDLYKADDAFRDLVCGELTEDALRRIQERLDAHGN